MSAAREAILGRIRTALGPVPSVPEIPREYRLAARAPGDVERFVEVVSGYEATVTRAAADGVAEAVVARLAHHGAKDVASTLGGELPLLSPAELDALDGVVTGCAVAIAETGTIALDGSPLCGRRALTLVPDLHVCVVRVEQIVRGVPEAIAVLRSAAVEGRPITLVSGPSATSDIELERVEGVHGPRRLEVIVVAPD